MIFSMSETKESLINLGRSQVFEEMKQEAIAKENRYKEIKVIELSELVGKLVISVSNEIQNVSVGVGKEIIFITQAQEPRLVVHDLVKKVDLLPMGKIFAYTKQKFDALNKLDANERIAIIYNANDEHCVDKSATQIEELFEPKVWEEMVEKEIAIWKNN